LPLVSIAYFSPEPWKATVPTVRPVPTHRSY
jgi:hypothetical protein